MANWEYTSGILPWTKSCFICGEENAHGLRLRSRIEGDRVVLDHVTREADLGWRHLVHGGLLMTLLDEVMTWAAILTFREASVAAELTVRLKAPVSVGRKIRAEGWTGFARTKLVAAEGRILDEDGTLLATATGKYMAMTQEGARFCAGDFVETGDCVNLPFLHGQQA